MALRVWTGTSPSAIIIPEGDDDIELRSTDGNRLVQIKSRREYLGGLPLASTRNYLTKLWERHDKFALPPAGLELILEQGIIGHATMANGGIVPDSKLVSQLPGNARGKALLAKTDIRQMSSPSADSIAIITDRMSCSPIAAALCVAQLLHEVGMLANDNGRLRTDTYRGLAATDTDRIITETLAATDVEAIEVALRNGACEPTDFLTPLDDPEFYLGVDAQAGHVAAGLIIPRLQPREALARGLEAHGTALVAGPSGAGKSAIMWDTAYSLRHTVRWYHLLRVDQNDLPALRQLVRALRATPDSPVGFVVDDIGRRGTEGWDALTLEFAAVPGAVLLGSIREEDLFLLQGRSRAVEVRAEPDNDLACRIFEELKRAGRTEWTSWQEPWERSHNLVLEYVHILTAGQRFRETLAGQVDARQSDPARAAELSILRILALTGATGATANAERLPAILSLPEETVGRSLRRLVDEHLVRVDANGGLAGLHQLRSAELVRLTHRVPPPTIATSFSRAIGAVSPKDIELLTAESMRNFGVGQDAAITALITRIQANHSLEVLTAALRGLGTAWISNVVDAWLSTESMRALAPTQVSLAAMFGVAANTLPALTEALRLAMEAAAELTRMRSSIAGDPRQTLLDALPAPLLAEIVSGASDPSALDQFLSSLNGMPLHPTVRTALATHPIDILTAPIDGVARLLGTLAGLDRDEAIAWVDAVGEQALVDRMPHEIAWATAPTFENTPDGRVIRSDYNEIGIPGEDSTHDRVVRICEVALALSPRSEIAASAARAPNGEVIGFGGLPLAEKRIPRANLPAAALPEWNRRWCDAIAIRAAAPTYSGYLTQAVQLLDRLVPALERLLNLIIRGKSVTDAQLVAINSVYGAASELRTPAITYSVASGKGSETTNASVTKLQNLLFAGGADVVRRFHKLPEDAGSFIAWTADLIRDIDETAAQEPWELVGGVPTNLGKMRELLVRARIIAGDAAGGPVHPGVKFATLIDKARPDNALRLVASLVEKRMTTVRSKLAASIGSTLKDDGIEAEVYVTEDPDGILPWPPSKVLVVVPLTSHTEVERHATAVAAARDAVPDGIRLTVIPKVDGRVLPARGVSGYETLLPLPDEANAWIELLRLPFFHAKISPVLNIAVATASALQSMDRLNLGIPGRPLVELETRERLEDEFASMRILLATMVDNLDPEGSPLVLSLLDRVRSAEANFADAVQEFTVSQVPNEIIEEVSSLQIALDEAEFRFGRIVRDG
ncbi:hypothetical protein [Paracoccus alkenifer]|uniref:hypothetical protein n=1 Tax=Paracoccus alkenifer TaxID=65735 RepID=UPI001C430C88|nr:hypothetical protein [Paracoccus alkenifer]